MGVEHVTAIVTGGGQGIGRHIALRLGRRGNCIVIADINEEGSFETAERVLKQGGLAKVIPTDITCEEQVKNLMERALQMNQRIDILVNNSGIAGPIKDIEAIEVEEWERTLAVNLRGMFLCCKHAVPAMKRQKKGAIVNIASITGKRPLPQRTPYAATKMGVIGFTRSLAAELGGWKIRVNAVCPGEVIGPRLDSVLAGIAKFSGKSMEQVVAERVELSPLKTFVDPNYVAAVVDFLCSEDAGMITGQDINVSAGLVMY